MSLVVDEELGFIVDEYEIANPAIICLRCEVNQMVIETGKSFSIEAFRKLPRGSQLLVAYCLYNKQWELQMMENDPDGQALVALGWFTEKTRGVERIKGVKTYEYAEYGFDVVETLRDEILASVNEDELKKYKTRKEALYPWLW
jgi:hypothetical protein